MADNELKVITPSDLGRGFKTADAGNSYELDLTNYVDNSTVIIDGGVLKAKPANLQSYDLTDNGSAVSINAGSRNQRMRLQTLGAFGVCHLDFTATRSDSNNAFTLPEGAPTPQSLIEHMTRDGGTVWVEQNSRNVKFNGLTRNSRYVLDLVGFWG